ncbi:DNA methyltransferase [Desulfovibrio sp.]|uniref:DNA methyltransferase n=1 Tax=Desulfovibrio sp. TaxID=885 RepID=UPI0025BE25C6|nr:DNA methyltransferase [Desulfovibrio sp.]
MHDLLAITRPGGTVLDPFMGGGAVGVACAESGRGYVGIELSAEYYAISRDRITQVNN